MVSAKLYSFLALIALISILSHSMTEARYLPTRSSTDRLEKLKELLKDLVENEIEKEEYQMDGPKWHPDRKLFYKREIPTQ